MSKQTFIIVGEKGAWVGDGSVGSTNTLNSIHKIDFEAGSSGESWGQQIIDKFSELRLSKKNVSVALDSCITELRPISIPPLDKKSLAPVVYIQAKSQLVSASEKGEYDFCPTIGYQHNAPGEVVASTYNLTASDLLDELKSSGFTFKNLVPQLLALKGLKSPASSSTKLWINVFENQIEFSLLGENELGVVRFAILPSGKESRARAIGREVQRTLSVVASQSLGGVKFLTIVHAQDEADSDKIVSVLEEAQQEFKKVSLSDFGSDKSDPEIDPGVKLIAHSLLHSKSKHLIDYTNPTKPPKEKADVRKFALIGAVAATVILGLIAWAWLDVQSVYNKTAKLKKEIKFKETEEKDNKFYVQAANSLNQQISKDPNWLNELKHLSENLPYGGKLQISEIGIGTGAMSTRMKKDAGEATLVRISSSVETKKVLELVDKIFEKDSKRKTQNQTEVSSKAKKALNHNFTISYTRGHGDDSSIGNYLEYEARLIEKEEKEAKAKKQESKKEDSKPETEKKESNSENVIRTSTG